jgi:hypothetical protein
VKNITTQFLVALPLTLQQVLVKNITTQFLVALPLTLQQVLYPLPYSRFSTPYPTAGSREELLVTEVGSLVLLVPLLTLNTGGFTGSVFWFLLVTGYRTNIDRLYSQQNHFTNTMNLVNPDTINLSTILCDSFIQKLHLSRPFSWEPKCSD